MTGKQPDRPTEGSARGQAPPPLHLPIHFVAQDGHRIPLHARFDFDPKSALVVTVTFRPHSRSAVHWRIGRDLLWEGVLEPSGTGDVRIRPVRVGGRLLVRIRLASRGVHAVFEADLPAVECWLLKTYEEVPFGDELAGTDWDALLAALFDGQ